MEFLENPSEADLKKAIELNSYDYFRDWFTQIGKNFDYTKKKDYFLGCSGNLIYLSNLVFDTHIQSNRVHEVIEKIFSYFKERNLPFIWLIGPQSIPANIKILHTQRCIILYCSIKP